MRTIAGRRLAMVAGLVAVVVGPASAQNLVAMAKGLSVASLDSTLPSAPLEKWLSSLRAIRPGDFITWEVNDCGEGGTGKRGPICVEAIVPLSGDTTAHLVLIVVAADGLRGRPRVFDLSIGKGNAFTGYKTLGEWGRRVRDRPQ
jgi:hypothetical protein